MRAMLIKNVLYSLDISRATHEAVCDEVNVLLYGKKYVAAVLVSQCRQVDMLSRHIDTLVGTKAPVVHNLNIDIVTINADDTHIERAIIEEDIVATLHILSDAGV